MAWTNVFYNTSIGLSLLLNESAKWYFPRQKGGKDKVRRKEGRAGKGMDDMSEMCKPHENVQAT